jgi:type VI secretion system protein ImpA
MPADTELLSALLTPIPGDDPAGRDLRYDPRYERVKDARREDADLPQGGLAVERKIADWPQVVTLATQLLERETKDLQLAAWLTEGLLRRRGMSGLATGLGLVRGLLDGCWEHLHPQLEDGDAELRIGPLEWIGGRLDVAVRQTAITRDGLTLLEELSARGVPTEQEAESNKDKRAQREVALEEGKLSPELCDQRIGATPKAFYRALVGDTDDAIAALAALEATSDARFGADAPAYGALRKALDDLHRFASGTLARKLAADPDPVEASDDGVSAAAAPAAGPAAGATAVARVGAYAPPTGWTGNGEAADTFVAMPTSGGDAPSQIAGAAHALRQQDPTSPAPYLLLRGFRWGELRAAAPRLDGRLLEAPSTAVRTRLKALLLDARWGELLEQCEQVMATPQGRGWLDLQRYVANACAHLGSGYDAVAVAVRAELASLLAAIPQLPEMTLMDDTPTANPETRAWLAGLHRTTTNGTGADAVLSDGSEALDDAIRQEDDGDALAASTRGTAAGRRRSAPYGFGAPADAFQLARSELARGHSTRAIELLVAELDRERSARGRFVRQTQIAHVMVDAGLEAVAKPILDRLLEIIEERTLADWEAGPLVAQPLALMCRVMDRLELDGDERQALYLKVCRLDPLQAIALRPTA